MGRIQTDGQYAPLEEWMQLTPDMVGNLRFDLNETITDYLDGYRDDLKIRIENQQKMRYEQTRQYYKLREDRLEQQIKSQQSDYEFYLSIGQEEEAKKIETLLRMNRGRLAADKNKHEEDLSKIIADPELCVKENIKSLNLVSVI